MRICFFLHRFPELSQTFVLNQVLWFLDRGHDVQVIAARAGEHSYLHHAVLDAEAKHAIRLRTTYSRMPESMFFRVASAPAALLQVLGRRPGALKQALAVRRFGWFALTGTLLHSARPLLGTPRDFDAIIAHFGPEGVVADALRQMKLICGPLVTFFHGYDLTLAPRSAGRDMYRSLFASGDRFLAISSHGADRLRELGADPSRTQVHHMGVSVARFRPRTNRSDGPGALRVLSVGRLVAKKGFADGIDAVVSAIRAGLAVEYRIIGAGPERESLRRRIREAGLGEAIQLLGPLGDEAVADALQEADVLLAPSITTPEGDHEGIPMVLMEALASGVPVVATVHGGIPELVQDGVSGLLVREHDTESAAAALHRLAVDSMSRLQMGASGRARVALDFNVDIQNTRLERLLSELTTNSPRH